MANSVKISAVLDDKVSSSLDRIRDKFDQLGGKGASASLFGNVGAKSLGLIGSAASKAGEMVGEFIDSSIQAASDLEQSVGGIKAVFGPAADKIMKFGETADKALGLSKNAVNEMATVIGAKLQGMGYAVDEAADKTLLLEQRGADMAATFGGTTVDAVQAISSLLSGERDPIEKYGVSIKEADVQARILAKGLDTSTTEAKKNATAVASLELLMESTAKATGRFAAETESLAGAQQIANAELANMEATLGQKMLPAQLAVTKAQINFIRGIGVVDDSLKNLGDTVSGAKGQYTELGELIEGTGKTVTTSTGQTAASLDFMADHAKDDSAAASLAIQGIGNAAKLAADKMATSTGRIIDSLAGARERAIDESSKMVTGYYDVLIAKDNLAATNAEIAAQRKILASSTSTAAQKADATSALHQLEKDQIGYMAQLASAGKSGTAEFTTSMEGLLTRLKNAHGEEAAMILKEIRYLNLLAATAALRGIFNGRSNSRTGYTTFGGGQAHGGPVKADTAYLVGEEGPELFIPNGSGEIIPNGGSDPGYRLPGTSSAGDVIVNLTYSPGYSTASPAEAQRFADAVTPAITRSMRRQSIIN